MFLKTNEGITGVSEALAKKETACHEIVKGKLLPHWREFLRRIQKHLKV